MSAVPVAAVASDRSRARLWRDVAGLIREMVRAHPIAAAASLALLLLGNARTGLYVAAMGGIVDALISGRSALPWVLGFIVANALEELYWGARAVIYAYLLDHATYRIQRRVLECASAAPLIQFEEGEFFVHLQRASNDMGGRLHRGWYAITDFLQLAIMVGSLGVALTFVHPALPALLVLGALPSIWLQARTASAVYRAERGHTAGDRVREHIEGLLTGREAAPETRLFDSVPYLLGRWRGLREARIRDVLNAERRRALSGTLGGLFSGAAYAGALVLVAWLILRGELSVGDWVTVATGALWFTGMMGAFVFVVRGLEEETQYLGDLFDFLRVARAESGAGYDARRAVDSSVPAGDGRDARAEVDRTDDEQSLPPDRSRTTRAIVARTPCMPRAACGVKVEARAATFAYPAHRDRALRGINLSIAPGERVAIVGANGAGKTTLVKLLIGLYEPDNGEVRLDGEPLTGKVATRSRRRIAAVFQDYATFHLMVRENVGFGDLARMDDDLALAEATRRAGIADFVAGLPEGYDTYLGRQFGDTELSGGQWQRLALARAFLRDADLLVLDEPSAALDPLAELALFERFAELTEGRTAIMISHRLGMARLANRVIVLEGGEIVEEGSHDDLLYRKGAYARMFATQAQWYR